MRIDSRIDRRQLLKWSTPVVVSIALPVHAQTSCMAAVPILTATAPKCSGSPPIGLAELEVRSSDAVPIVIKDIRYTSTDPNSSIGGLGLFPITVTQDAGESFNWMGPAGDATACLPTAALTITIEYCCDGGPTLTEDYDLITVLVAAEP